MKVYKAYEPVEEFVRLRDEEEHEKLRFTVCKWCIQCRFTKYHNCNDCPAHGKKELASFDEALVWWGGR